MPYSQVSFEPRQVVVDVSKDQHTHDPIDSGGVFSLNFPDGDQEDLARKFTAPLDNDAGTPYTTGEATGAPLSDEAIAHLECRVVGKMETGDHTVHLGKVASAPLQHPTDVPTNLDAVLDYGG